MKNYLKLVSMFCILFTFKLHSQEVIKPEIVIWPKDLTGTSPVELLKDPIYVQGASVISTRLKEKGFKTPPLTSILRTMDSKKQMGKSQGGNETKKLMFPGDFRFEYNFSIVPEGRGKKVRIRFSLIENGTDDEIGSGDAVSDAIVGNDVEGLITMAVDNAIPKLISMVSAKWEEMKVAGMVLKLDINLATSRDKGDEVNGKVLDRTFEDFLDSEKEKGVLKSWAEGSNSGGNLLSYTVSVDMSKVKPGQQSKWARGIEDLFKKEFALKMKTESIGKNLTFEEQ